MSLRVALRIRWGVVLLVMVGAAGTGLPLGGQTHAATDASAPRAFSWSADPSVAVLTVEYGGSFLLQRSTYRLYGDGRLVAQIEGEGGGVLESLETYLEATEARSLIEILVESGFLDTSQSEVDSRLLADGGVPTLKDGGHVIVVLKVDSYAVGELVAGPLTQRLAVPTPKATSRRHPGIEQLRGIVALGERLVEFRNSMREAKASEATR